MQGVTRIIGDVEFSPNVYTSVSPKGEIGSARNVEIKILKMFQKGFKLKFLKGHKKIFHNNNFIFQPYIGLKKCL